MCVCVSVGIDCGVEYRSAGTAATLFLLGHHRDTGEPLPSLPPHTDNHLSVSLPGVTQWDPNAQTCVSVFTGHSGIVYEAAWAPHLPHTFASVSGQPGFNCPPYATIYVQS